MFDPRDILAEYLAEHSYASSFDPTTNELTISIGSPDTVGDHCAICGTPVTNRQDVGWTHDVGYKDRGGCTIAWPVGHAQPVI